jgi:hypothetical protein
MSDAPRPDGLDLRLVDDPGVRQALRSFQQHIMEILKQQQTEMDALLDLLMEKNITSLGEFKRQLMKLQQNAQRSERIHSVLTATSHPTVGAAPAPGMHGSAK